MYKLDLPLDLKEVAAIERRRNREQQRQSRIFNAKVRTIGVDVEVLKCQVEERKLAEAKEKAREESFDADRVQSDKVAQILEAEQNRFAQSINKKVQEFREQMQPPEARREFDLYDPNALKKDKPARVSDDDPRCGPASLQKLAGEDLNKQEREKVQEQRTRKWLTDQRQEKEHNQAQSKYAEVEGTSLPAGGRVGQAEEPSSPGRNGPGAGGRLPQEATQKRSGFLQRAAVSGAESTPAVPGEGSVHQQAYGSVLLPVQHHQPLRRTSVRKEALASLTTGRSPASVGPPKGTTVLYPYQMLVYCIITGCKSNKAERDLFASG
ncbi:RIB43A-like with coiled-coils protein 2 isoform X2 [Pleurodeles waltl]|uniref:RIB43A-like with coiled-coils protein 2 isoform X2 n=1 Tax=Pleurodeles waltl TaxID=8319 RepID=UPI0037096C63